MKVLIKLHGNTTKSLFLVEIIDMHVIDNDFTEKSLFGYRNLKEANSQILFIMVNEIAYEFNDKMIIANFHL